MQKLKYKDTAFHKISKISGSTTTEEQQTTKLIQELKKLLINFW